MGKESIKNKFIGTRHGEKKHEVLVSREELVSAKEYKNYFQISNDNRNLNYDKYFVSGSRKLDYKNEYNSSNTKILTKKEIKNFLRKMSLFDEFK